MGIYAFTLAGSNYIAPVICGFIAEYQGWGWVFYWPAIFLSVVFVFLFLFMEETNYNRTTSTIAEGPFLSVELPTGAHAPTTCPHHLYSITGRYCVEHS